MRQRIKNTLHILLITVLLLVAAAPGFAAAVRRVPSKNLVEQGFLALTLDAEGAEDFRYIGQESQYHLYKGKIKPGAKIKLIMQATLAKQSSLPLTGRTCTVRMEVIAKKGGEVIKKNSYKSENKSNVFINYTVPEGADTLEVNETFVLNNKSKEEKFNQQCTTKNKLILTTTDGPAVAAKTDSKTENGDKKTGDGGEQKADGNTGKDPGRESDKKTAGGDADKKNDSDKKGDTENNKTDAGDTGEGGMSRKTMMAGAVVAIAAIVGGYFFMKRRKEDQAITEAIARKEKLRQQAIRKQQELLQHNLQQPQEQAPAQQNMPPQEQQPTRQDMPSQEQQPAMPQQAGAAGVAGAAATMDTAVNAANTASAPGVAGAAAAMDNADAAQQKPGFCTSCGAPLKPGTRFCENCGAKV